MKTIIMAEVIITEKVLCEVTKERYLICDKCENRIEPENSFDLFESKFVYKTGEQYPEGGNDESFNLDLCQKCGLKAVDLLQINGFKMQMKEVNW